MPVVADRAVREPSSGKNQCLVPKKNLYCGPRHHATPERSGPRQRSELRRRVSRLQLSALLRRPQDCRTLAHDEMVCRSTRRTSARGIDVVTGTYSNPAHVHRPTRNVQGWSVIAKAIVFANSERRIGISSMGRDATACENRSCRTAKTSRPWDAGGRVEKRTTDKQELLHLHVDKQQDSKTILALDDVGAAHQHRKPLTEAQRLNDEK